MDARTPSKLLGRGPGRPRNARNQTLSEALAPPPPEPRKRGRPRKNPLPEASGIANPYAACLTSTAAGDVAVPRQARQRRLDVPEADRRNIPDGPGGDLAMLDSSQMSQIDLLTSGATAVHIEPPRFKRARITIVGTAPYVQHRFSEKSRKMMEATQRAGAQERSKRRRVAKDFEQTYRDAMYVCTDGWNGIPASSFRNAMISVCRIVGFKMTHAKLAIFIEPDGFDKDGTPLVRIEEKKGQPHIHEATVRNESGVADVRWRPMWDRGWSARVTVRWDEGMFSAADVMNLMARAGLQVGIGEGRPDSPKSNGLGWGLFEVR